MKNAKTFTDILKFNPYHGKDGRFTSANGAISFTYAPGKSKAHDNAIAREKERQNSSGEFHGVLYHGSPNEDIEEFDINLAGRNTGSGEKLIYFTDSKQMADDFSYERLEGSSKFTNTKGKKGKVYEVEVEMKKPLDFRKLSDTDIDNILKLDVEGLMTREEVKLMASKNHQLLKAGLNLTADALTELGYDGFIANTGKTGHNSLEYAVVNSKQTKIIKSANKIVKTFSDILKFNPYHDERGRFTSAGSATLFTYSPGKSKAHDNAIAREKERMASIMPTEAQAKTLKGIESRTRNLKKEQFRVVDRDGNVIMEKQGDKHSVSYKVGEARDNFPGNITIHNHPDGGTFSTADLSDIGYGATEIRAAAPEGTYILRNIRYGTKWTDGQKSWVDMKDDLDLASIDFKSGYSLKKEVKATFSEEQKALNSLANKWVKGKENGESQHILDGYRKEYDAAAIELKGKVEKATRKAYTDQYHTWIKQNSMNYGLEYEFVPVQSRTKKSYEGAKMEIDHIENIQKSDEIVLDGKMNSDIEELTNSIMDELIGKSQSIFPERTVAKTFNEILKSTTKKPQEEVIKAAEEPQQFHIMKTDDDKRLVFGWANVAITKTGEQIVDHQNDMVDPEDLEEAVYDYVLDFRDGGEEHIPNLRKKARMVESCMFTKEKMEAMGIPEGVVPEGWWIGFYVDDDDAWDKVKKGIYQMFSIEGKAIREEVEDE